MIKTALVITLLIVLSLSLAVANDEKSDQITIDDLSWLAGRWVGEGFDGECEEVWNPPMGNSMTGSFKLVINNKVAFYELMTFTVKDGRPALRLKHFNADLTGWEEKGEVISFEFSRLDEHFLEFDGLSYELTHSDSLTILVDTKDPAGQSQLSVIKCHRD